MKRLVVCICVLTPLEIFSKTKKSLIGVLFLTGLMLAASCIPDRQPKPPAKPVERADGFVVFLTGSELGALKPCGCSGGQLGGLDRRWAVLNSVPRQRKLIVDIGSLVESDSEQDLIKFNIIIQAFGLLDYDVVNLTEKDIEIAKTLGLLDRLGLVFNVISAHRSTDVDLPVKFTKQLALKDKTVTITIAAFDAKSSRIEQIEKLFPPQADVQTVNILILNHCDPTIVDSVAEKAPIVDCLVCPSDSDEPRVIGDPNKKPLVFSVGRFGRYICKLDVTDTKDKNRLELSFHAIPIGEDLKQGPSLVRLYKDYQQLVKEANLLEKYPRFVLPNDLKYVGSKSCKPCHQYEYQQWSEKAHARAYATLEKVGSQYDPECIICHVVGMEYESGFISEQKTAHLKDVGCENCHGPGSEHVRTLGKAKTTQPKSSCLDCHTPEKSSEYAGNEQRYLEKIRHWREPNTADNVK